MNFRGLTIAAASCITLALSTVGAAQASEAYKFTRNGGGGGTGGSDVEFFELTYSTTGGQDLFGANIKFKPEVVSNGGFWIVTSDGPNPKGAVREYAILYADLASNRITAYEYSGANRADSFVNPGNLLQVFNGALTTTAAGNVSFNINVTSINAAFGNAEWDGVSFDEDIGLWFHFSDQLHVSYRPNGRIDQFNLRQQGFVDFENRTGQGGKCENLPPDFPGCGGRPPVGVSEPATVALLGLGLVGLSAYRRRDAK